MLHMGVPQATTEASFHIRHQAPQRTSDHRCNRNRGQAVAEACMRSRTHNVPGQQRCWHCNAHTVNTLHHRCSRSIRCQNPAAPRALLSSVGVVAGPVPVGVCAPAGQERNGGCSTGRSSRPEVPGARRCAGDTSGGPRCPSHACAAFVRCSYAQAVCWCWC